MKRLLSVLLVLLFWSCSDSSVNKNHLHYLNGYWEISEVEFPNGSIKEYGLNPSIDFIELKDNTGFRKKLKPNLNGTYDTSNHDVEMLTVKPGANEEVLLIYENEFSNWEEKLVQLDSLTFSVVNQEGVTYRYKRFEPIKIPQ